MVAENLIIENLSHMLHDENFDLVTDGDHTFCELYHHRTILFAALCNAYPDKSWVSKLHDDHTMYDGYFIAGIETRYGQATYHCSLDYWDLFDKVNHLDTAPKFDGHSSSVAINRIAKEFTKDVEN